MPIGSEGDCASSLSHRKVLSPTSSPAQFSSALRRQAIV